MSLSGLSAIHIELTSKCGKTHLCPMCGHQDLSFNRQLQYGDMEFSMLESIREQLESGVEIHLHRDGESTDYPRLRDALELFQGFTVGITTHGLNLAKKANDIIGRCTTIAVSIFRGNEDHDEQYAALVEFLKLKGGQSPMVVAKIIGDADASPYEALGLPVIRRLIHTPGGNERYAHTAPTVPEIHVCWDALHHPAISWDGRVFLCVRLDPDNDLQIGDLRCQSLEDIWNGPIRHEMIEAHKEGKREEANPLCASCHFWGVPSQWTPQPVRELPMVHA